MVIVNMIQVFSFAHRSSGYISEGDTPYVEDKNCDNIYLDNISSDWLVRWLGGFNVGLELYYWTIADGLRYIPNADPETCHCNFDPPRRG